MSTRRSIAAALAGTTAGLLVASALQTAIACVVPDVGAGLLMFGLRRRPPSA